ncbi:DUF1361 domain-containing protein [Streptococcus hyointestinalis]|uniref:DUF1361 domain-containing protein n=1 Tax=Streptococcus hyointestinalis TaxID=1337 RepID=UPI0023F2093C|nr:DUF1361 domain-containing protein [Streptococcus hyointestinalis]MCI6872143.1 DUF1361 domain-containing protein [Streptococcus hyointestinalis]MDD6384866.1 DUF1361 domain-containing protein [Streptococcus hyointestinalis]MDD7356207.1 DUF1361 domain-containing protein [Streptococcus hyointestinalis]MDY4554253.1 DUF1361 domain-containing protein [Streptococcus hyointestinalis]
MKKKIILIHLFFAVISLGIKYYQVSGPDLVWNMFLALVAFDFAALVYFVKQPIVKLFLALFWFFFYPNTFYMLTDIVHMNFTSTVLWEKTSLILYMLFVSSILFGVLSGTESVKVMFKSFKVTSYPLRLALICALSVISSFAIHIGRYARLNSWDILTRPKVVIDELASVWSTGTAAYFVLGFTFLQILTLVFLEDETLNKA